MSDATIESDAAAAADLVPLYYADLHRLARRVRFGAPADDTLQTTALIHEAYLKLCRTPRWNDRAHFLRASALAMRQVLVDDARSRLTQRRGEGQAMLSLDDVDGGELGVVQSDDSVLALDEALQQLAQIDPRLAQVVECRYFGGYTDDETAGALGVTARTVQRDWLRARAWLYQQLGGSI
ncbi:sigma-70 family RNA polymerase sigma factor [Sinimarinibacterium sp. CAU 1509]|uniref:ECF-type sigma factor n=1 Tax=Sinimarinibacterium sp. CAU 1509 TaxID=2562283 RepID=UPI0010AC94C2|nr:ECF-type sigma factor [Sinimarinibacterium sp. CAU 1509]TJY59451.1 sigma-70 family RNA polymerase sigma factor [Sinimarinibacterium sp. CAU 1509]